MKSKNSNLSSAKHLGVRMPLCTSLAILLDIVNWKTKRHLIIYFHIWYKCDLTILFFELTLSGPTNCFWSSFGEWSRCSVSCGAGTQQRKRMVLQPARNGGLECVGEPIESRPCSQVACPGMNICLFKFYCIFYVIMTKFLEIKLVNEKEKWWYSI